MQHGDLRPIDPAECLELLAVRTVGMVAFVDDDGQQLVPVNYVVRDGDVIFRTSADSFLAQLADGHEDVAFATSHQAELDQHGWNVTVRGRTSPQDAAELVGAPPRTWAGGVRDVLVRLHPEHVSGRRVHLH